MLFWLLVPVSEAAADYRPRFVECPQGTVYGLPCETIRAQVRAVSQRWPGQAGGMRFKLVEGPGTVNPGTGEWLFKPTSHDIGRTQQVEILAADGNGATYGNENCRFSVYVIDHWRPFMLTEMESATIVWSETYSGYVGTDGGCLPHDCNPLTFSADVYPPTFPPVELTQVSSNRALVSWTPGGSNIGTHLLIVSVQDACGGVAKTYASIRVYNQPPQFERGHYGECASSDPINIIWGETAVGTMTAEDPDFGPQPLTYSVISFDGPGIVDIDPFTGEWEWVTNEEEQYVGTFQLCFQVTDGANLDPTCGWWNADTCCTEITVISTYRISIEQTKYSYPGQHDYVDVTLDKGLGEFGGYDLVLAYDRAALNFQTVMAGPLADSCPDGCGWEYFNYRIWFWPPYEPYFFGVGIIHVVSMADVNNGSANRPCCFRKDEPVVLFTVDFLITDNPLYECQFTPVRFFWTDCGDNTLATRSGDTLLFSRQVFGYHGTVIDPGESFPSYGGAIDECLVDTTYYYPRRLRLIDYRNGGVDIACLDSVDDRGDVNVNGLPYEVADFIVLSNYFIYGFSAFHINVNGQIKAADVNRDGQLEVADLVLLGLVVTGQAGPGLPADTTSPHVAVISCDGRIVIVRTPDTLGAALIVCEGIQSPTLLQDDMEMKYAYNADENLTRILIYSFSGRSFTEGSLLSLENCASLLEATVATYNGAKVRTTCYPEGVMPRSFALHQNYPNPFNDGTVIRFDLPASGKVDFDVLNVLGEIVYSVDRAYPGGRHQIEWNGTDNNGQPVASGVYYYRLKTPQYVDSKKMILLK